MSNCPNRERIRVSVPIVPSRPPTPTPAPPPPARPQPNVPAAAPGAAPGAARNTQNLWVAAITTLLLGGGSLGAALRRGGGVQETWGVQIAASGGNRVHARAMAADALGSNLYAVGEYEGGASFTTIGGGGGGGPFVLNSAGRPRGGYIASMSASTGQLSWFVDVEASDTGSGAIVGDVASGEGSLFAVGVFASASANIKYAATTGTTNAPTQVVRAGQSPGYSGMFVLRVDADTAQLSAPYVGEVLAEVTGASPKIATGPASDVYVACTESNANTTILLVGGDGSGVSQRVRLLGATLHDLAYVADSSGPGYYAVIVETVHTPLTIELVDYTAGAPARVSNTTLALSGLPSTGASLIVALEKGTLLPKWVVSASVSSLDIAALVGDGEGGVYFVGTQTGQLPLKRYLPPFEEHVSTQTLPASNGASDISVGHLRRDGVWDPTYFGADRSIGGVGADHAQDIDYNHVSNRLVVGGTVSGAATVGSASTSGSKVQSLFVSLDATTATPKWASVAAGDRDLEFPLSVVALPVVAGAELLEGALSGSFAGSLSYRSIDMVPEGSSDGFVLPATAPSDK